MKHILLFFIILSIGCSQADKKPLQRKVVNYDELQHIVSDEADKLLVVNFWATWCKPCVEELPHFMEVNEQLASVDSYKMILVSLDKADMLEDVYQVAKKLNLNTDIYILSDNKRMNEWIPAIDSQWSGAIPATVFFKNGKKVYFTEGQLTKDELISQINTHL